MDLTPFHGPPATAPRVPGFAARTLLGFGTHGEVWLADDLSTGGSVALKIGRQATAEPAAASGDPPGPGPEPETALLCRIDHPHIVRLQRVVPLPAGGLAMVLDLAAGGNLASLVAARGRFAPGEVSTLLVPLAEALDHLHRLGLVHGDVAPGNVLFTGEGRPQLGDLGVARLLGPRIGAAWATTGFTDPALIRADRDAGPDAVDLRAADLWGLAAVGWFALTGRPPEPSLGPDLSLEPSLGSDLSLEPSLDGGPSTGSAPMLGEVLTECLTAAPADRPSLPELADRVWQAARPTPVRLVTGPDPGTDDVGLPPLSSRTTGRVPRAGDPVDGDPMSAGAASDTPPRGLAGSLMDRESLTEERNFYDQGRSLDAGSVGGRRRMGVARLRGAGRDAAAAAAARAGAGAGAGAGARTGAGPRDRASARSGERAGGRIGRFRSCVARHGSNGVVVLSVGLAVAAVGLAVTIRSEGTGEQGMGEPGVEAQSSDEFGRVRTTVKGLSASTATGRAVAGEPGSGAPAGDPTGSSAGEPDHGTVPGASGEDSDGGTVPGASAELEAELTRALIAIGRSRAAAFGRASARFLAGADVTGSPAYQADLELVQRLRSRGYRLQGVRYEVSGVQVLRRRGELVDVRASVTTSRHRQVRISSGVGVAVPADGPRTVVLTVAPVDLNASGPDRWRVRSVQAPS